MEKNRKDFTLLERVMVVAILLFVAALAIQNVARSVSASEENTAHEGATEYSALRSVYAEQSHAVASGAYGSNSGRNTSNLDKRDR